METKYAKITIVAMNGVTNDENEQNKIVDDFSDLLGSVDVEFGSFTIVIRTHYRFETDDTIFDDVFDIGYGIGDTVVLEFEDSYTTNFKTIYPLTDEQRANIENTIENDYDTNVFAKITMVRMSGVPVNTDERAKIVAELTDVLGLIDIKFHIYMIVVETINKCKINSEALMNTATVIDSDNTVVEYLDVRQLPISTEQSLGREQLQEVKKFISEKFGIETKIDDVW